MADEQSKLEAAKEREEPVLPLTSQEFADALDKLVAHARTAGLRPLKIMAATYVRQSMGLIDGLLAALDGDRVEKVEKVEKVKKDA